MHWRDLGTEALAGMLARPVRSALTTLGTVLGITTLVITLGVGATAGNQISGQFTAAEATRLTATIPETAQPPDPTAPPVVPWDALPHLTRLNGVVTAAAVAQPSKMSNTSVRSNSLIDPLGASAQTLPVVAASRALPAAAQARVRQGRFFDEGDDQRADRVAVLGEQAARQLGIYRLDSLPAVFIGNDAFLVIGILGDIRRPDAATLASSVILPPRTAAQRFGFSRVTSVLVTTRLGAAPLIARQAPLALSPGSSEKVQVLAPPNPATLRAGVEHEVNGLFLVLGLVSLVVGAIGIANVTLVTVMERVGEIGLRRSLGASRRHIAAQFLAESTMIGLIGGIIGASLGIVAVVGVSLVQDWTPVLDMRLALGAPVSGALVGLVAGLHPSLRAARMEPAEALRAGT
ncbi:ABC transporter permease [Streptomyces tubercidicus]